MDLFDTLKEDCIDTCHKCVLSCGKCIVYHFQHTPPDTKCAEVCLDCKNICTAMRDLVLSSQNNALIKSMALICKKTCENAIKECKKHDNPICRECVRNCMDCKTICKNMIQ